jgi:hypothetical protein
MKTTLLTGILLCIIPIFLFPQTDLKWGKVAKEDSAKHPV